MEFRKVRRSYLGVACQLRPISRAMQRETGHSKPTACQAVQVHHHSPAGRAGVLPGDLLLAIDGKHIGTTDEIHRLLPRPGSTIQLTLLRPGVGGALGSPFALPLVTEDRPD